MLWAKTALRALFKRDDDDDILHARRKVQWTEVKKVPAFFLWLFSALELLQRARRCVFALDLIFN